MCEQLLDRAAVLFAFEQLGSAQVTLEVGVEHAKNRYAFGRPIGSFQAIKNKLADMFVLTELARSNCYYGAWALSHDAPELGIAAANARGQCQPNKLSVCKREFTDSWWDGLHLGSQLSSVLSESQAFEFGHRWRTGVEKQTH